MKMPPFFALSLCAATSLTYGVVLYENDFESDTPGSPPASVTSISASSGNEVIVLDASTTPANPLSGQSMYVHDLGSAASVRVDIELSDSGTNVNNLRVDFDFQRAYEEAESSDVRIDFGIGPSGAGLNSSANRPFDLRILNRGDIVTKNADEVDPATIGTYDTANPNSLVILLNSHNENAVDFDYPDIGSGTLPTNSYQVFLNNTSLGTWAFFTNLNYYTESNVLGKMAFFQDTSRSGGIVFDNLKVATIFDASAPIINDLAADNLSVVAGDTTRITVGASGSGDLTYQWYLGSSGDETNPIGSDAGTAPTLLTAPITGSTSYWARVSNADGFADSGTITIETHTIRDPFTVNNQGELNPLLGTLIPGDTVIIPNGEYTNWRIDVFGQGTEQHPVRLVAETPGFVRLTGTSTLNLGGVYTQVEGLVFVGPYSGTEDQIIDFRSASGQEANHCRLTDCAIIDYNPTTDFKIFWVNLRGTFNRVDHSYFSGLNVKGVLLVAWLDNSPDFHLIDHNHFANRAHGGGANEWETIRLGTSEFSLADANITVSDNLFEKCNGEIEIISNKSGQNVYQNNTFYESAGALTLRHGNGCMIDSNIFIGNNSKVDGGVGGVRLIGTDHIVTNNYFEGITDRHDGVISIEAGIPSTPLAGYQAPHNATIAFNTIVNSPGASYIISNRNLGSGHNVDGVDYTRTEAAQNVTIANNLFFATSGVSSLFQGSPDASTTWEGNIAFGASTGGQSGVTVLDPLLSLDPTTALFRPLGHQPGDRCGKRGLLRSAQPRPGW